MSTVEKYGRFDPAQGCFELTAEPPRKWRNIHYNQVGDVEMYAEVSNLGDGPIRIREADGTTVNLVSWDSKFIYIRDDEAGQPGGAFSPWGAPLPTPVEGRVCRFFAAKTEISSRCNGLKVTQRVFVPRSEPVEATTVFIENLTDKPRKVSVFHYAQIHLTGNDKEGKGFWKDAYSDVLPEIAGVLVTNRSMDFPTPRCKGYLVTLSPGYRGASGYRDHFTRSEFSLGTPRLLWGWNADNRGGFGPDCAGVVQVTLTIPPHGKDRADFLIGHCAGVADVKAVRARVTPAKLDQWCDEQMQIEKDRATKFTIDTGPENTNRDSLINIFVKKQLYSYLIEKSGFRDNLQIDNAIALFDYPLARANLLRALTVQKPDGSCLHGFRPLNRHQYSDKPAWILQTVPWLIKESGDLSILKETVPYFESGESGTVWDHVQRAYRFLAHDLGKRGLCRQHFADWNDALEPSPETGERESVMVSQQLCFGLLEVAELADLAGDKATAEECRREYQVMKKSINDKAWDGQWYVRTICEDGYCLGSNKAEQGKILINSQSWAVLSKVAEGERAKMCMDSLEKMLGCDYGYMLCAPPLSKFEPRIGKASRGMPGSTENGGCYNHAAGFKAVADCMLGRPENAWDTWLKVVPDSPWNPVTNSEAEPFSFNNMYQMVPQIRGQSGYPWRTGTAGWFAQLIVEWILGARRSYQGLLIDPCLTKRVPRAKVTRTFRGTVYHIDIDNTAGRCIGARSITLDGKKIEGNVLPLPPAGGKGGEHQVKVVI